MKHRPKAQARPKPKNKNKTGNKPQRAKRDEGKAAREWIAHKTAPMRFAHEITIGKRFRKDKGDIAELARLIDEAGALLHPPVITPDGKLIAGERRTLAWPLTKLSQYGKLPMPVRIVDIPSLVRGEYVENAGRKDFTPEELVAIKRALEPELKRAAKERQRHHGGTTPGKKAVVTGEIGPEWLAAFGRPPPEKHGEVPRSVTAPAPAPKGRAGDAVAALVGRDRRTIEKAEAVVEAAEQDPARFGKLRDDMNRTGKVDGPYKRLQVMRQAAAIRAAPPPLPMTCLYETAVFDYPWPHEPDATQEEIDARGRSLRPYAPMAIETGLAFMREAAKILAAKCTVYFWTTNFHMPYAFALLRELGFEKHSTIGTWIKPKLGRGQVLREKTEHCIIALRGKPLINLTSQTTDWSGWKQRENSRKPDEFYAMVEQLSPAPRYADIFSRGGRGPLWDCHGDEIGKFAPAAGEDATAAVASRSVPRTPKKGSAKPHSADPWPDDVDVTAAKAAPAPAAGDDQLAVPPFLKRGPNNEPPKDARP